MHFLSFFFWLRIGQINALVEAALGLVMAYDVAHDKRWR